MEKTWKHYLFAVAPESERVHAVSASLFARLMDIDNRFPTLAGQTIKLAFIDCLLTPEHGPIPYDASLRVASFDAVGRLEHEKLWAAELKEGETAEGVLRAAMKRNAPDELTERVYAIGPQWQPTEKQLKEIELLVVCDGRRPTWCPKPAPRSGLKVEPAT